MHTLRIMNIINLTMNIIKNPLCQNFPRFPVI